jgi:hypothetical protein
MNGIAVDIQSPSKTTPSEPSQNPQPKVTFAPRPLTLSPTPPNIENHQPAILTTPMKSPETLHNFVVASRSPGLSTPRRRAPRKSRDPRVITTPEDSDDHRNRSVSLSQHIVESMQRRKSSQYFSYLLRGCVFYMIWKVVKKIDQDQAIFGAIFFL